MRSPPSKSRDVERLSRPGFKVLFYDTLAEFYLAEALEYINAWRQSTDDNPVGICGPIGPTEQLPLVARIVNELELDVRSGHFWGMDEWFMNGAEVPVTHPLSVRTRRSRALLQPACEKNHDYRTRICIFPKPIPVRTVPAGMPVFAAPSCKEDKVM
jgi:hypothetical protein